MLTDMGTFGMTNSNTNPTDSIAVILTGATGMVGEGVLLECLVHPAVERVLVVGRKPCGRTHPKLSELIVADFLQLDVIPPIRAT